MLSGPAAMLRQLSWEQRACQENLGPDLSGLPGLPGVQIWGIFFQEVHHVDRTARLILADTRSNTNQAAIMRRC